MSLTNFLSGYARNNNNWGCLQNLSLILSNTILKWSHLDSNIQISMNTDAIFEERIQILLFIRGSRMFLAILKNALELL
jgi:hypothetical protein